MRNNGYFPACARPGINEAYGQTVIAEQRPNQLHDAENVPVATPVHSQ